jgi:hypothetical protein
MTMLGFQLAKACLAIGALFHVYINVQNNQTRLRSRRDTDVGIRPLLPPSLDLRGISRRILGTLRRPWMFAGTWAILFATGATPIDGPVQGENPPALVGVIQGGPQPLIFATFLTLGSDRNI